MNNVYIGIIAGSDLKTLYDEFGDGLFFENVREFLGPSSGRVKSGEKRVSVNEAIVATLDTEPEKFLSRNNGITFRADTISVRDDSTLHLENASIVNGCQTTMGLVQNPNPQSYVLVKMVQATDSWDLTKAANFQNAIDQIDLELAKYIRPQLVKLAASRSATKFQFSTAPSAFAILDAIYEDRISYEEMRSLYIGLFSSSPNNAIAANYTEVSYDVLQELYQTSDELERIFDILFQLHQVARHASAQSEEIFADQTYANVFRRFWRDDKPGYRSFLIILTACGCVRKNVYLEESKYSFREVVDFLNRIREIIDSEPEVFMRYYRHAFTAVGADIIDPEKEVGEMVQDLYSAMKGAKFNSLYLRLCMFADNDDFLRERSRK
jgi:hypothetical protein